MKSKFGIWTQEFSFLSAIAVFDQQEVYTYFTSGYKQELNFCMRTITGINEDLKRIDEIILSKFIPVVTGNVKPNIFVHFREF